MRAGKVYLIYPRGAISTHTRSLYRAERPWICVRCHTLSPILTYYTLTPFGDAVCQVCQPWLEPWATSYLSDPEWVTEHGRE